MPLLPPPRKSYPAMSRTKQYILGAVDAGCKLRAAAGIGMHPQNETAVRGANLLLGRAFLQSQGRKRLWPCHVGARSAWRCRGFAPIRTKPAIEIGFEHPHRVGIAGTFGMERAQVVLCQAIER